MSTSVLRMPGLVLIAVLGSLFSGCLNPTGSTSRYMAVAESYPSAPPEGKVLLFVHRPHSNQGWPNYANVWDGQKLIADLGNGHTVFYVCDPGQHWIVCRAPEHTSAIKADFAPDQIYDAVVRPAWSTWIPSFKIHAIPAGDERREDIPEWLEENLMHGTAGRTDLVLEYESEHGPGILEIIARWEEGDPQLGPADHR